MGKIATFKRYELKFMLDSRQFKRLLPTLQGHMELDPYCRVEGGYRISNLYYDTCDNHLIRTSVAKPYYKEKLRIRGYGFPMNSDDEVFVELKKKVAGIVYKRRATMALTDAYAFVEQGKFPQTDRYIDQQVTRELQYFLTQNNLKPAVFISYSRMAFFGKDDPDFRVTFDYDLISRRDRLRLEEDPYGEPIISQGRYLMEVKVTDAVPKWLADSLAGLNIYKQSFSKYGTDYQNLIKQKIEFIPATTAEREPLLACVQ